MYIRALSFADIHVVKRKALKKVLGFYTDYAASFDKELRLAVNICEVQHFKKIKRRKRGTSEEVAVPGISRLIGQFQNNQKGREKEKKLGRNGTAFVPHPCMYSVGGLSDRWRTLKPTAPSVLYAFFINVCQPIASLLTNA